MRRLLAASAASGAVGVVAWLILAMIGSSLLEIEGLERLAGMVVLIPIVLFVFVLAPLIAGLSGGLVSRSFAAAVGSVAAYLAINVGAIMIRGAATGSADWYLIVVVISGVLVLTGHLTGVTVRPRPRPA